MAASAALAGPRPGAGQQQWKASVRKICAWLPGLYPPAAHLAFSSGIHYCLGQPLARLEATIAIQTLAERMPHLAQAGPVRRRGGTIIRGPLHLPVTAGRAAPVRQPAGHPG